METLPTDNSAYSAAHAKAGQMYSVVQSIREFDKLKLGGILSAVMKPSGRENCFLGTYYLTAGNIDSLLALNSGKYFQAGAMITRSLFELAVDITLIDKVHRGWMKMIHFVEVEKLRSARKLINFNANNPGRAIDVAPQTEFIAKNEKRIEHNCKTLWPHSKLSALQHWSEMTLSKRVRLLGKPFDEMYNAHYPRLSWYAHPGLTGVLNLPSDFFPTVHGFALSLSIFCYSTILETVIHEMKIDPADDKIIKALEYATLLPFAQTPELEIALMNELLK